MKVFDIDKEKMNPKSIVPIITQLLKKMNLLGAKLSKLKEMSLSFAKTFF